MEKRKQIILRIAAAWLGIILILTFFSNTIYALNLPNVAVGFISDGIISSTNRAEGVLDFVESKNIYSDQVGRLHVNLQEGDRIGVGDLLFSIHVDIDDLQDRLEAERHRLERTSLSRSASQNQLQNLRPGTSVSAAQAPIDTSRFDHEADRLLIEIARVEAEYAIQQNLLNAGIISRDEFAAITNQLEDLHRNYNRNQEERLQALENHQRDLERTAADNQIQQDQHQRTYTAERNRLQNEINLFNLDENEIRRQIQRLETQIEGGGIVRVYAENTAIIHEIAFSDGMHINRNQLMMRLGVLKDELYSTSVYFPERIGFLPVGTQVQVDIPSLRAFGLHGKIVRMTPSQGRLRTEVVFETDMPVSGGEGVRVTVEQFSELFGNVLPNSAIRNDNIGSFVLYVVRERNTLLGYSYVANKMYIHIFEDGRGERYTAFHMFTEPDGPIIIQSDRPVIAGGRVRLVGEQ